MKTGKFHGYLMISEREYDMGKFFRNTLSHPALALGSTMLWGLIECFALMGSRRSTPSRRIKASKALPGNEVNPTH
jgi:hypothetical protein